MIPEMGNFLPICPGQAEDGHVVRRGILHGHLAAAFVEYQAILPNFPFVFGITASGR
jgi:hypothetical protein